MRVMAKQVSTSLAVFSANIDPDSYGSSDFVSTERFQNFWWNLDFSSQITCY